MLFTSPFPPLYTSTVAGVMSSNVQHVAVSLQAGVISTQRISRLLEIWFGMRKCAGERSAGPLHSPVVQPAKPENPLQNPTMYQDLSPRALVGKEKEK